MKSFRTHFTTANLLSIEVILISTVWAVFSNLTDPITSGPEATITRVSIVVIIQVLLFLAIWFIDLPLIKRIRDTFRPFLLLLALLAFALTRGYLVGKSFYVFGVTAEEIIWPRLVASLTNQGILIVLLTVSYGLISKNADFRHSLLEKRNQLAQLVEQVSKSSETQNLRSVERVRTMLKRSLEIDEKDTPEQTLNILRDSIDEVVKPFSRALIEENRQPEIENSKRTFKINWSETLRETLDLRSIKIFPTFLLVFLIGLGPSSRLLSFLEAFQLYLTVAVLSSTTFLILKAFANKFLQDKQRFLGFPILLTSVSYAIPLINWNLPEDLISTYIVAWYGLLIFTGFVPAFVSVALKQSNLLSTQIQAENEDLEWELVRARATARQHRQAVSTALHGNVQATLSAAALQLQRAINDRDDVAQALINAKSEAQRSIDFTVDFNQPPAPIQNTINEVIQLWYGVASVESVISVDDIDLINSDPICARSVSELIVELCLNAVKHADSNKITIAGNWINQRIFELVVSNDFSEKPGTENASGLGTSLLEQLSLDWERVVVNDRFVVAARLPWKPR